MTNEINDKNYLKIFFKHDALENITLESAWCLPSGEHYILDNILFYAKEYSLGDTIEAELEEDRLMARGIINESGNSTVRVLIYNESKVPEIRKLLNEKGCSNELSNISKLISVNIPRDVPYIEIRRFLDDGEEKEEWSYEESCISTHHQNELSKFLFG